MRVLFTIVFSGLCNIVFAQIDTINWMKLSPLPDSVQRTAAGYFLIDSDLYIAGGQLGDNFIELNTVWQYHIPTDAWVRKSNLPFGAASTTSSLVLNAKGYFLIALDSSSNNGCDRMFWEYNPITDVWTRKAEFPDSSRGNSVCFTYNGKGYVGQTYSCNAADSHFWEYDPTFDQWSQIATLPADVIAGSVAIATLPADAYLFGGYDLGFNFLHDIWRYNIVLNQWDSIGQMPGLSRSYGSFWGFDSVIVGGGGMVSDNDSIFHLGNDFYKYDIKRNLWTPLVFQNSFDSTGFGAAFIYNKRGYYFGGLSRLVPYKTFSNDMWSFDASRYLPDTTTGITNLKTDASFILYPNPVSRDRGFSISTSESGEIFFYDELGRTLDERKLNRGITPIKLATDEEVVFYRATLQDGSIQNGKVVLMK
jgi:N-acetylneuraminic acid mutarotase